jgi:hypothetical protein
MVKKITIPCEFRCELAIKGWTSMIKGFMYVIRERHEAAETYACVEKFFEMDDRMKNLTNFLKTVFKIEGNDAETIIDWLVVWYELLGFEYDVLERSKTINRHRVFQCPFKTRYKDIGEWCTIWTDFVYRTINPRATHKRPKGMCAGDPYCEIITKIEE